MIKRYWTTAIVAVVFNKALFQLDLNSNIGRLVVGMMVGVTTATVFEWIETIQKWWDWKNQTRSRS